MIDAEFPKFPVLETERLILRQLTTGDTESIFEVFSSEEIMKYYGMYPIAEIGIAENIINEMNEGFEMNTSIRWGIELKSNKTLIGTCGFHSWKKSSHRAEVGYELSNHYWGQGYAKEALKAVVIHGFEHMCLNRIEALVYPENRVSQLVLEKIGFQREGLLREYMYFRDKPQDLIIFSLLRSESL